MAKIEEIHHPSPEARLAMRLREIGERPLAVVYNVNDWYLFEKALGHAVSQMDIQAVFKALLRGKLRITSEEF